MNILPYFLVGVLGFLVGVSVCPLVQRIRGMYWCPFLHIIRKLNWINRNKSVDIDYSLLKNADIIASLIENSPTAIFVKDTRGRYLLMNRQYEKMFKVRREEMLGKTDYDIFPASPELVDIYQSNDCRVIESGGSLTFEEVVEVEGIKRPFISVKFPLTGSDGIIRGVCGISTDISDRKAAEDALRRSEDRFRVLFDFAFQLMGVLDLDGRVVKANKTAMEYLAGDKDIIGKLFWETPWWTHDPEQQEKLKEALALAREGQFIRFETTHPNPLGGLLHIDFSLKPVKNEDGEVELLIAEGRDITARILAERQRQEMESLVQHSQRMESIGQLAGGIAHDFNNLLTAIQGNAELLKMENPNNEKLSSFVGQILQASNSATELNKQLLSFARKRQMDISPINVNELISEVAKLLTAGVDKRIRIKAEYFGSPLIIMGDLSQLQNALLNMGFNARDAMPEGGEVTFKIDRVEMPEMPCSYCSDEIAAGQYVEISVADTGGGIAPEIQSKVFEPFFTTKAVGKGTGLGLAGVYGCVKSHGGHVLLDSRPGCGSTFRILLPESQTSLEQDLSAGEKSKLVRGTGNILVVDDEEGVRKFVSAALRSLGYQVQLCCNGQEAVEYYRNYSLTIDLVILDLTMPKLSGADAFRQIHEFDPAAKVIITSGYSSTRAKEKLLSEGALAMVHKPFSLEELSRVVSESITKKGS